MKVFITILCLWMLGPSLKAETREKKYEKSYPKASVEELVLTNQFGKMEIVQVDGDEIQVVVNMKVTAKTGVKADETLELIQVVETVTDQYIHFETGIGKDFGMSQLLRGTAVNVDYKVSLPKGIRLRLISTNGNVYLTNFSGEINADIRSGDFKATALTGGELFIKQEKGIFNVEKVGVMTGEFRNSTVRIAAGEKVKLITESCEGELESIGTLNLRSSGGTMKIGDVEVLTGSSSFTKYEVLDLGDYLDMDMKMGELNVRNVQLLFSEIHVKGSFTKVGLAFMKEAGYQLELKRNKSLKADLPQGLILEEEATGERNVTVGRQFVGNSQYSGKVFLDLSRGSLFIQN